MDEEGEEGDWEAEETKTRFTDYSCTSSVMRRSDGLTLLDQRFEKVQSQPLLLHRVQGECVWQLYEQYDQEELGDLEEAAVEGEEAELAGTLAPDSDRLLTLAASYQEAQEKERCGISSSPRDSQRSSPGCAGG